MRIFKFLSAAILFLCFSSQSFANPRYLYGFSVTDFGCKNHPVISCPEGAASDSVSNWTQGLNLMTIGFSTPAVASKNASFQVEKYSEHDPANRITNNGVRSFNATKWNYAGASATDYFDLTKQPHHDEPFELSSYFDIAQYLTGFLVLNNGGDEIEMRTSGSNLWSGSIKGDEVGMTDWSLEFAGEWKFIRLIPEPGTPLLLLGAALAALAIGRKKTAAAR